MSNMKPAPVTPGNDPSHAFAKTAQANIQRSRFDLSHEHLTTLDAGYLYPLFNFEVVPGDTFDAAVTGVVQMLSLKQQLMDSLYMDFHWWFVPNRLTWSNWARMQGERDDPDDDIDFTVPVVNPPANTGFVAGSYADYMGYPLGIAPGSFTRKPTALYLRALNLIYNTWYRDQNLIDSVAVPIDDGPDEMTSYPLLRRGKRKDYFTSCLPWPQKGDAVTLPLGGTAPISAIGSGSFDNFAQIYSAVSNVHNVVDDSYPNSYLKANTQEIKVGDTAGASDEAINWTMNPRVDMTAQNLGYLAARLQADLTGATSATINALRLAATTQQLLERDARGGTRLTEIIHSHFGVVSPDARLQRPEYLGGGTIPINIHSVVNQTATASGPALGQRAAFGQAQFLNSAGFTQSFTEHGVILCLGSVRSEYKYWQGLSRRHTRYTRYEHYLPTFANLGEQEVLKSELLLDGSAEDNKVFGYQERWAEMRCQMSQVTGKMRPSAVGTLAAWHLAQTLTNSPVLELGQDFIEENPPLDRVVAVPSEPIFNADLWVDCKATRPLPVFSTPGITTL